MINPTNNICHKPPSVATACIPRMIDKLVEENAHTSILFLKGKPITTCKAHELKMRAKQAFDRLIVDAGKDCNMGREKTAYPLVFEVLQHGANTTISAAATTFYRNLSVYAWQALTVHFLSLALV